MWLKYVGWLTLFLSAAAAAETAYVTDNLRLGLHQQADTSDRAFRTLESGQEIEVLDRNRNYAHVRLPDGAEGYLKAAYLVFVKPAKLIVAETQAEVERLQTELAELKVAFAAPAAAISSLELELARVEQELQSETESAADLSASNRKYKARHEQFKYSLPLLWVGSAMLVCLLCGFLGGLWWVDRKSRLRHGGIRVY
jgi:SH3 domain protein